MTWALIYLFGGMVTVFLFALEMALDREPWESDTVAAVFACFVLWPITGPIALGTLVGRPFRKPAPTPHAEEG